MTGAGARTGWGPRLTPPRGPGYMAPSSRGGAMTAEDVGGERARERALLQAEKMETIGRLTGAIAQQFSELPGAILQRAAAPAQSSPPSRDLDELKETAQRGAELAHKLLGFSRHKTLDLQPLSLTEYVREMLDTLRRELPGNIEVQFEADEVGGVVEADAAEVRQILMSLVTNARDAMPKGGTLHVEVRRARLGEADRPLHAWVEPGSYVSVAVSDTGTGMTAATLARVFEPFFTTKPLGVGTGLGMSMVYGLVKQHRGFVHLYSETGQGTTAKVYFPAVYRRMPALDATAEETLDGERAARPGAIVARVLTKIVVTGITIRAHRAPRGTEFVTTVFRIGSTARSAVDAHPRTRYARPMTYTIHSHQCNQARSNDENECAVCAPPVRSRGMM